MPLLDRRGKNRLLRIDFEEHETRQIAGLFLHQSAPANMGLP